MATRSRGEQEHVTQRGVRREDEEGDGRIERGEGEEREGEEEEEGEEGKVEGVEEEEEGRRFKELEVDDGDEGSHLISDMLGYFTVCLDILLVTFHTFVGSNLRRGYLNLPGAVGRAVGAVVP